MGRLRPAPERAACPGRHETPGTQLGRAEWPDAPSCSGFGVATNPLAHWSKLLRVKASIHPDYQLANVHCSCGNQFYTRSTKDDLHVELCSECHPFYTGKQKLVDTGGRVERFQRRQAKTRAGRR
jgi:large subunit ribosomal protein L31